MRVAVITRTGARVGGAEAYVERAVRLLSGAGHEVALFCEHGPRTGDRAIDLPPGVLAQALGSAVEARRTLGAWRADVVFSHGLDAPAVEEALLEVGPVMAFMHDYHGTCVSGSKTHGWPVTVPCRRTFGPACLVLHHALRCGGLDPRTTLSLHATQARRLDVLRRCARVLVLSEHMRREAVRHGVSPERVTKVPCLVPAERVADAPPRAPLGGAAQLVFVGRMEPLKGGAQLLAALPSIAGRLGRDVALTLAGDGGARAAWERAARRVARGRVSARFVGWLPPDGVAALLGRTDLLVVPSVWPEPFGLVGLEAGLHGVPTAAYRVGGIEEWLAEGDNGALAPGDPPTPGGLADAVVRCLASTEGHASLREGARRVARSFTPERHLAALEAALLEAARQGRSR